MNAIKKARLAAGLSQNQMADLMEIPVRTIQDWENDRRIPPRYVERLVIKELNEIAKKASPKVRICEPVKHNEMRPSSELHSPGLLPRAIIYGHRLSITSQ